MQNAAGEWTEALENVEAADRAYREAMGTGGETEAWRMTIAARALLGAGETERALERAESAVETAVRRELYWQLSPALILVAEARAATGRDGVETALDEAETAAGSRGHTLCLRHAEEVRAELLGTRSGGA